MMVPAMTGIRPLNNHIFAEDTPMPSDMRIDKRRGHGGAHCPYHYDSDTGNISDHVASVRIDRTYPN